MAKTGAFRFWCQKVLPLVYDDSIGYYELLNKMVVYLNNVIQDFDTVAENFDNLDDAFDTLQGSYNDTKNAMLSAYDQLQSYVNNYFDDIDIQEEINNTLDQMAEDGTLSELMEPFIESQISAVAAAWLQEHITPTTPAVDSSLTVAGAAADAKVTGDRIEDLQNTITKLEDSDTVIKNVVGINKLDGITNVSGYINASGAISPAGAETEEITYDYIKTSPGETLELYVKMKGSFWAALVYYDSSKTFKTRNIYTTGIVQDGDYYIKNTDVTIPDGVSYFRLTMRTYGDSEASITEIGIAQKTNMIENALKNINNIYVEKDAVKGYVAPYNGNLNGQTNYKEWTSDYIPVGFNSTITVQIWANPTSSYKLGFNYCEYDSEQTYLRGNAYEENIQSNYYEKTFTTQNVNCAYIRISGRLFDNGHMMVNSGDFGTGYMLAWQDVKAVIISMDEVAIKSNNNTQAIESMNLFVRKDAVVGFISTDGTVAPETAYREMTSDFIPVSDASEITVQTWTDEVRNLAMRCMYFNSSKEKIHYTDIVVRNTKYISKTFTLPENTAYIRIASRYLKTVGHMMVNLGNVPMQYMLSWQDLESRFSTMNSVGETGLKNPLLRPAFPRIAMHRGFMSQAPENTIPAFTLAGQAEAWGIETDVWETTDGYFVISHDDDVSRMTDGTGNISEMTYAQTQECTIDAGANIEQYPNLKMPLLEDYLKICRRYGCVPCIEIKGITNYSNFINTIKAYGMEGSTILTLYWNETVFNTLRELTSMPIMIVGTGSFADILGYAQRLPDLWINMISTYITKANLDLAHAANVPVAGWTYNLSTQIENAVEIGMDIAISESVAKLDNN